MQGRTITCSNYKNGVAEFTFDELCDRAVGSADYLAICQNCPTVLIRDIPQMSLDNKNILRRFIKLIDELYNHKVKVYCLAEVGLDDLYKKEEGMEKHFDEAFAIDRTISRLKEMQTTYYFEKEYKVADLAE